MVGCNASSFVRSLANSGYYVITKGGSSSSGLRQRPLIELDFHTPTGCQLLSSTKKEIFIQCRRPQVNSLVVVHLQQYVQRQPQSSQPPKASTTFVIVVRRRRSRRRRPRRPKRWIFALAFVSAVLRAHDEVVVVLVVRVHEAGDLLLLLNARVGENRTSKQCLLVRLQSQFSTVTTFRGPRRHHYKGTKTTASLLLWRPLRPQPLLQCTKNLALPRSFDLWWLCKVKKSGSFGSRKRRRNDCEKWIRGNWIFLLPLASSTFFLEFS